MTWVKLDDSFADHPKIEEVGPLAAWLHVTALCYCGRHLTDGLIPKAKALRLAHVSQPSKRIAALLDAGLWHDEGGYYRVHDYLEYQPSREQIEGEREKARTRMADTRAAKRSPEQTPNVPPNFDDRSPYPDPSRPVSPVGQDTCPPVPVNGHSLELAGATVPTVMTPFDAFWMAYPLKKAKGAARKAWTQALKKAPASLIIEGAHRYRNDPDRDPDPRFTKHPASWLNAGCWEDEPAVRGPRMSKSTANLAAWAERTSS